MALIGAIVQIFSKAGFVAQSVAMLMWSCAIMTSPRRAPAMRPSAWIGIAAGLIPAGLLLLTDPHLTPHSLMVIVAMHSAWYLAVAWSLYAGRVG